MCDVENLTSVSWEGSRWWTLWKPGKFLRWSIRLFLAVRGVLGARFCELVFCEVSFPQPHLSITKLNKTVPQRYIAHWLVKVRLVIEKVYKRVFRSLCTSVGVRPRAQAHSRAVCFYFHVVESLFKLPFSFYHASDRRSLLVDRGRSLVLSTANSSSVVHNCHSHAMPFEPFCYSPSCLVGRLFKQPRTWI